MGLILFKSYPLMEESISPAMSAVVTDRSLFENCLFGEGRRKHENASFVDDFVRN